MGDADGNITLGSVARRIASLHAETAAAAAAAEATSSTTEGPAAGDNKNNSSSRHHHSASSYTSHSVQAQISDQVIKSLQEQYEGEKLRSQ